MAEVNIERLLEREHAQEMRQMRPAVLDGSTYYPLTEMGNAERFVSQHGDSVRYCHDWRAWLAYDGVRWKRDAGAEVRQFAKQTVRMLPVIRKRSFLSLSAV